MKKFRWILLSGLLVATTQIAQAQPSALPSTGSLPGAPGSPGSSEGFSAPGAPGGTADAGAISNGGPAPANPSGVSPDGSANGGGFIAPDDAASGAASGDSSIPNTGGEPMIAVLAGLSIAGAAVAMRRKVAA